MKRLLAGVALASVSLGAQAADMSAKVPVLKAPAMLYDWTGFYLGANVGVGLGRDLTQDARSNGFALPTFTLPQSYLGPQGAIGGAQAGYNWQFNWLVLGVEADIQASGMRDDRTCVLGCNGALFGTALRYDQKLDWFGTARARAGFAIGPVLSYVTGGFAFGGVKTTVTDTGVGGTVPATATSITDQTRSGWTIGSGTEAALAGNWTAKLEYLYMDLGRQTGAYTVAFPGLGIAAQPRNYSSEIREHVFRAGLNYRFGGNAAYSEPLANWAGFYVGGNAGTAYAHNPSTMTQTIPGIGPQIDIFDLMPHGYLGGGQIGFNWQAANWVFGVEGDIQGSGQKDDKACQLNCVSGVGGVPGALSFQQFDQRMGWLGTARGRVGYSVGATLFYATAGVAFGEVKTSVLDTNVGPTAVTLKQTRTGWTAGGGIESPFDLFGLFGKNWTAKTEYLYVDLGSSTGAYVDLAGNTNTFSTQGREHIFRSGLNYHFTPVVAK